ncbi:DUF4349 domain-containing protein [Anaerotalea alkaliphila]|uniref:DUF4349 domain-containing protein n=1 Tax=Anaerotalea alkaliphila TaxID=2662126 RepID=A0A7X5HWX8_9FIRM|nr:DUF4349 domain-containing protein [Anaerotalea alkaliphila]NDL68151.1 DUF4349 domain-containing protein [Anaerotalea alkaliphila]
MKRSRGNRKRTGRMLLVLLLTGIVLASACGSRKESPAMDTGSSTGGAAPAEGYYNESVSDGEFGRGETSKEETGQAQGTDIAQLPSDRKMIENVSIQLETTTFLETEGQMMALVGAYQGYVEWSNVDGIGILQQGNRYQSRRGSYTIRIPVTGFSTFVEELKSLGNTINTSVNRQDVTTQVVDLEARLKSLQMQEERLLAILAEADELQYVLELERELADVRYRIETNTAELRNLENRVRFGTVQLQLIEVIRPTEIQQTPVTVWERISTGFLNAAKDVGTFFVDLFVFLVVNIPYLVILAFLALVAVPVSKLYRRWRGRHSLAHPPVEGPDREKKE